MAACDESVLTEAIGNGEWIGRGELMAVAIRSSSEHHEAVREFLRLLKQYGTRNGITLAARIYPEIGLEGGNLHHHFLIRSTRSIPSQIIKYCWKEACGNRRTTATCEAIRDARRSSRYATKASDESGRPLLARGTKLRASYGHRSWFGPGGIEARWESLKDQWFGEDREKPAEKPALPRQIIPRPLFRREAARLDEAARDPVVRQAAEDARNLVLLGFDPPPEPEPEPEPYLDQIPPGQAGRRREWSRWVESQDSEGVAQPEPGPEPARFPVPLGNCEVDDLPNAPPVPPNQDHAMPSPLPTPPATSPIPAPEVPPEVVPDPAPTPPAPTPLRPPPLRPPPPAMARATSGASEG